MKSNRFTYARRPLAWPSLVVIALWLGIWGLWPRMDAPLQNSRPAAHTRVRFVELGAAAGPRREDLLGFLFQPRARELIADVLAPAAALPVLEAHPHLLDFGLQARAEPRAAAPANLAEQAAGAMRHYQPLWPALKPFEAERECRLQLAVQPCRDLAACGFSIPPAEFAPLDAGDKPWEYTFYVVCGTNGRPRDVLALSEPVLSATQSNVLRAVSAGMTQPGAPCEGRVTVRWAAVPVAKGPG